MVYDYLSDEKAHVSHCPIDIFFVIDWIFIKPVGKGDRDKSSVNFLFGSDQNIHLGVSYLLFNDKKPIFRLVRLIACLIFIGSLSNLQSTATDSLSELWILARSEYLLWSYRPLSYEKNMFYLVR